MSIKVQGAILVVDDMMLVRRTIIKHFKELGASQFIEASSGREAFEKLSRGTEAVGLALIDWSMPDAPGIDLLTRLKGETRFKELQVIMMFLDSESEHIKEALGKGSNQTLTKPFGPIQINDVLKKLNLV
ncbi:MAG: response regulator [Xanthomonadaceae bacterium]|nr:response regulator [Xanthomonadaceae bacterium]